MTKSTLGRVILAVAVICGFIALVPLQQLVATLSACRVEWLLPLISLSFLLVYVSSLKWLILYRALGGRAPLSRMYALYLVGYFVNLLAPSAIGGDIVRSWSLGRGVEGGQQIAASATLLERYTGLLAMLTIGGAASLFLPRGTLPSAATTGVILAGLGACSASLLLFTPWGERILLSLAPGRRTRHLASTVCGAGRKLAQQRGAIVQTLLLSLAFHAMTVGNVYLAARAVSWAQVSLTGLAVVVPVILLVSALPVTPQGLGIQEGAYVFFLGLLGASPITALAIALLLRAKTYLLALVGGGIIAAGALSRKRSP